MSALLEVRGLEKRHVLPRGVVHALSGVDLEIGRGERLGLVGESGSGKSTLARCLVGLERPSAGSILLDGQELAGRDERAWHALRRRIQIVFQDPLAALDPRRSVGASVAEPLEIHRLGRPAERRLRVLELLEAVGLTAAQAARFPHELSGGQRQRVGIARALALEPELLVLDEPVSALDVSIQAQIVRLFHELGARFGLAYLFISHDLAVVRQLCPRVAVLYLGRVVESGATAELFAAPAHPYTRALLDAVPSPDPLRERGRVRELLSGEPPSPLAPPPGCAFHPRCPRRDEVPDALCARARPALEARAARLVACHLRPSAGTNAG